MDDGSAQLQKVANDGEVHAVLLMDLLRLAHRLDPAAYRQLVERAERELHELAEDPKGPMHCAEAHRVLERRLTYLRAAEIVSMRTGQQEGEA